MDSVGSADEFALIERTQRGDADAFQILLHRYLPVIQNYAARMLGNSADAADIAQEVFIRFWQKSESFDNNRAKLSTWLHQIAHNLCIDHFRRNARFASSDELPEEAMEDQKDETHQHIKAAIAQLPERQRSALLFCHYQGLSNKQAAEILEVSVDALESLLARARKSLRNYLSEQDHE